MTLKEIALFILAAIVVFGGTFFICALIGDKRGPR